MKLSPPPDLSSNRRLFWAALAVTVFAGTALVLQYSQVAKTLGDPDDAMRLVLVRDLMSGQGWYDQLVTRLQPPLGTMMHWSRLVDGLLAAQIRLLRLALSPAAAEITVRLLWPLSLILPAVFCALAMARRLGGSLAVFVCAVFLGVNQLTFAEFIPGRIDHHNIQIVLVMIAMACAMAAEHRARWALLAGTSTGLGLAVGIEGLPFHVVAGASYALMAALGRDEPRSTRHYALSLLAVTLVCYGLQTPPWRWTMAFCDAIGVNLVTAVVVAAAGLAGLSVVQARLSPGGRIAGLAVLALAAALAYLAFDPRCIRGVFAAVDPRLQPFWFSSVFELQSLPTILSHFREFGIALILMSAMMIGAVAILLIRQWPRPDAATWLAGVTVLVAVTTGFAAFRMENYLQWLGFPVLASAFAMIAARYWKGVMVPTAAFAVLLSPLGAVAFALQGYSSLMGRPSTPGTTQAGALCHDTADFRRLAALSPGLVLADIYMGPFILANTPHTALTAPYHRMTWGILAAHDALSADARRAEEKFRALHIDYLVECPASPIHPEPGTVEDDLARGTIPPWLEKLSTDSEALQVYRVRADAARR